MGRGVSAQKKKGNEGWGVTVDEEEHIRAEIEKRKRRARDLKIVDNVFRLYREHLRYLEGDLAQGELSRDKNRMPASVTSVVKSSSRLGGDAVEQLEIALGEKTYIFAFKETTILTLDEYRTFGRLAVKSEGTQVLELSCTAEDEKYLGTTWEVSDVTAFLEGAWVEEINRFAQQVFSLAGQQAAKSERERNQKELEDLKKNFGL